MATGESPAGHLRFGNITYHVLQDIELAVLSVKELRHMLSSHYRCYLSPLTTVEAQIEEFEDTQYHSSVVDPTGKRRLCAVMRGMVLERNAIVDLEGVDFLKDRRKYIDQCLEVFVSLSPVESGCGVSPARYSVLVPCPNSQSLLEDLTFIDYEQYEDISIAVKVTKRINHILREVFHQPGENLDAKIRNFPYDANNIKRKILQASGICKRILTDRYVNNFDNRTEFINLSQSIFANLIEVLDSGKVYRFGDATVGANLDVLSNTTDENNITPGDTSVSTYHISTQPPQNTLLSPRMGVPRYPATTNQRPSAPRFSPPTTHTESWGAASETWGKGYNNYEKLPSFRDETISFNFDAVETSTRKDYRNKGRLVPHRKSGRSYGYEKHRESGRSYGYDKHREIVHRRVKKVRKRKKHNGWLKVGKYCCVGVIVVGILFVVTFVMIKYFA